jgi:hypothetical protein
MDQATAEPTAESTAQATREAPPKATPGEMPGDIVLRALGPNVMTRGTKLAPLAWWIVGVVVVATAIDVLLRPALTLSGAPIPPLSSPDAQQMAAWAFLAVPVAMYLWFWLPGSVHSLVQELRSKGVIADPKSPATDSMDQFAYDAMHKFDGPIWTVAAAILIVAYGLVKFRQVAPEGIPANLQLSLDILVSAPVIYAATLAFSSMIEGIWITSDLFDKYSIQVFPHHPDGAGGLGPIGKRVSVLAWAGAIAGSAALFINWVSFQQGNNLLTSMETVFGVGVLLVAAPLVVWFWLRAPHEAMLEARARFLTEISTEYDRIAREPIAQADEGAIVKLKASTELLQELDKRAEEIQKTYPAWPIHTTGLRAVWAVVAAPLVAGAVGIVLDDVRTILGG